MGELDITVTGPAAAEAPVAALSTDECTIRHVPRRCAVVLIAVFGDVEPTRAELDLINAVSQASGRCAVGLVGSGGIQPRWRAVVPPEIPVGAVDGAMGRTLHLLSQGPPRAHGVSAIKERQQLLREQLAQERARHAKQQTLMTQRQRARLAEAVRAGLEELVDMPRDKWLRQKWYSEYAQSRCETIATEVEQRIYAELQLDCCLPTPPAPAPVRTSYLTETVVGVLLLGGAIGAGRFLVEPLGWLGVSESVSEVVAVVVGVLLAVGVVWGNVRRKALQNRRDWIANYAAVIRRRWEGELDEEVRRQAARAAENWRVRALTDALNAG